MKKPGDHIAGPHDFWVHFWCGAVVGGAEGAWVGSGLFLNRWLIALAALVGAGIWGYCCGRWGEAAWQCLFSWLDLLW